MTYVVQRYDPRHEAAVLDLMGRALGWRDGEPNGELFRWKHRDSAFGPSPGWVAVEDGQVIGFRTFMRWEFLDRGEIVRAVRAVDTATDPRHQGRGVFRTLTLQAVDELRADGVSFVFNTPNDQSRPGYLKMGWQVVGRLPVAFRPRSLPATMRMARARVPAELWSVQSQAGGAASEVLADGGLTALLANTTARAAGLTTQRTPGYLRWRYGLDLLHYRAMLVGRLIEDGLVIFRVRRRGSAVEATLCEVLGPSPVRGAVGSVLRLSGADYAIALRPSRGLLPLPRQGPLLTCLPLGNRPMPDWEAARLSLGDIELF